MSSIPAKHVLALVVVLSLAVAAIEAASFHADLEVRAGALSFWGLVFALLLAWWVVADSGGRPNVYRPFKYGWLVFLALPFYLPYYLLRTRGVVGLVWLLSFALLYTLGFLLQWAIWVAG
jgi:hypothetical protein